MKRTIIILIIHVNSVFIPRTPHPKEVVPFSCLRPIAYYSETVDYMHKIKHKVPLILYVNYLRHLFNEIHFDIMKNINALLTTIDIFREKVLTLINSDMIAECIINITFTLLRCNRHQYL